jgi:hypothetical protein
MFDGPTDLIVLPCGTNGTVARTTAEALSNFHIPQPSFGMKLGSDGFAQALGALIIAFDRLPVCQRQSRGA